ncbi:NAD(P)-dependent oxidoreductase [Rhizobium sp. CG4]|uniref:NAD-dependent epimerase/dehydratase family protein n=1 Tax=Rhizobium sp. CG4 TaxID=2726075 RepID=UPI0020341C41|nr:NAD(P)-dependent oxidoreductase [Rhizobium sp. CG4]MCM2458102.1 NAD(P)-dependent oxidoreductase [Rhizobium sp. CG4]
MPTYLVTGGSGFIGTTLTRRLVAEGSKVISLDLKEPRERLPNVDYRVADVRDLSGFKAGIEVDHIYNFAAVHTTPGHQPYEYYSANVAGASEITKFAEQNGVKKITFTSSISVYGPSEEMKTEGSVPAPQSDYGHSKLLSEKIHLAWLDRAADNKLVIVRPAVVFGQGEGGNFTRLAQLLKKGFFIYPGRKNTIKACIYVEDLINAILFAEAKEDKFVLFNGAYPGRYTLEEIVSVLIKDHFPTAREYMVPRGAVSSAATLIKSLGLSKVGIHPERVTKLVRSTDIYPDWLKQNEFQFPETLNDVMSRWSRDTRGSFV